MSLDFLLSPPVAFLIFLLISYLVYLFGKAIGVKATAAPGKLEPYACGEDFVPEKFSFGYRRFFIAAIFFTMMHVAVLTIATVPGGVLAYRGLAYLVTIAASITILYTDFD
jgi:NADH:ubiquinone oxidoreductase subunit 3 (subunit A)